MATKHHPKASINLNLLHPTKQAVRVTPAMEDAHVEMVSSIRAHGLLQPLVVRAEGNEFYVVAGNRRYAALLALVNHGDLEPDAKINCTVLDNGDDTETALAENTVRVAMHPADQAEAFAKLAAKGVAAEDIGNRFGLPKRTVQQRLRLGKLHPALMEKYRAGDLDHGQAQAYATTANTEQQMAVFESFQSQGWGSVGTNNILNKLQENRARSDSPIAEFVGSKAYHDAGGASESTLFEDYSTFLDTDLLERLAKEKLEREAERLRAEGWKWIKVDLENDWAFQNKCDHTYPKAGEPTPEESEAIAAGQRKSEELGQREDAYYAEHDDDDGDVPEFTLSDEEQAEWDPLQAAHDTAMEAVSRRRSYSAEQRACAGVILSIGRHDGKVDRADGLVAPGDPMPPGEKRYSSSGSGRADAKEKPKGYPQGVRDSIMELRTGALRQVLLEKPDIALDVLVFNMALSLKTGWAGDAGAGFYPHLPLGVRRENVPRNAVPGASDETKKYLGNPGWDAPFMDTKKPIGEMFEAYRKLSAEAKASVVAFVVQELLLSRSGGDDAPYDVHRAIADEAEVDYGSRLLAVDGAVWNVDTYWGKLKKDQIIEEARPFLGDEWAKEAESMKKKDLAAAAAERMRDHREWLPKGF